jgi:probable rRNA maturation factor
MRSAEAACDGVPTPPWRARLCRFCARACAEAGFAEWEIGILLCGDERITVLNGRYRGKQRATDVLSFPRQAVSGEAPVKGDIAISLDTLRRNAARYGVAEDEELKRLLIHGILHLAGMDHGRGKGRRMLALQEALLVTLRAEHIMREGKIV